MRRAMRRIIPPPGAAHGTNGAGADHDTHMRPFTYVAVIVFALVALVQLARFVLAWPVSINGVSIPVWVSALAAVVAALLAVMLWREATSRAR